MFLPCIRIQPAQHGFKFTCLIGKQCEAGFECISPITDVHRPPLIFLVKGNHGALKQNNQPLSQVDAGCLLAAAPP
eukprot:1161452-Pelagomonas_calceolata.AAC.7